MSSLIPSKHKNYVKIPRNLYESMCISLIERLEDVGLYFQMLIKVKRKKRLPQVFLKVSQPSNTLLLINCFVNSIHRIYILYILKHGLPRWLSGEESSCQCRRFKRCRFDPWVRKMP